MNVGGRHELPLYANKQRVMTEELNEVLGVVRKGQRLGFFRGCVSGHTWDMNRVSRSSQATKKAPHLRGFSE